MKFCRACGRATTVSQEGTQASKTIIQCTNCGTGNLSTYNVCIKCGLSLRSSKVAYARMLSDNPAGVKRLCIECGAENPKEATHCGNCGRTLMLYAALAVEERTLERPSAETIDTVSRVLLYILSLLIPLGGMIAGVILYVRSSDPRSDYREVGKLCLIFAIISYIASFFIAIVGGFTIALWGPF